MIAHIKSRTESRQPCECQLAPIYRIVGMLSVFPKNKTAQYAQCGHRTSNLTITIRHSKSLELRRRYVNAMLMLR